MGARAVVWVATAAVLGAQLAPWRLPAAGLAGVGAVLAVVAGVRRHRVLALAAVAVLAASAGRARLDSVDGPAASAAGDVGALALPLATTLEGEVADVRHLAGPRAVVLLRALSVDDGGTRRRVDGLVRLTARCGLPKLRAGDGVRAETTLRAPRGFANPGSFDVAGHLARRGVRVDRLGLAVPASRAPPAADRRRRDAARSLARATGSHDRARGAGSARGRSPGAGPGRRERYRRAAAAGLHPRRRRACPVRVRLARRARRAGELRARSLAARPQRARAARPRRPADRGPGEPRTRGALRRARRVRGRDAALGDHDGHRRAGRAPRAAHRRAAHARAGGGGGGARATGRSPRDRLPALVRVGAGARPRRPALGAWPGGVLARAAASDPRRERVGARRHGAADGAPLPAGLPDEPARESAGRPAVRLAGRRARSRGGLRRARQRRRRADALRARRPRAPARDRPRRAPRQAVLGRARRARAERHRAGAALRGARGGRAAGRPDAACDRGCRRPRDGHRRRVVDSRALGSRRAPRHVPRRRAGRRCRRGAAGRAGPGRRRGGIRRQRLRHRGGHRRALPRHAKDRPRRRAGHEPRAPGSLRRPGVPGAALPAIRALVERVAWPRHRVGAPGRGTRRDGCAGGRAASRRPAARVSATWSRSCIRRPAGRFRR